MSGPAQPPPAAVRIAVRRLLERTPAFREMDPGDQRKLANALVRVSGTATDLIAAARSPVAVATALDAGQHLGGQAVDRVAATTRSVLTAVSFERFVTELVNGVFGALIASNVKQMQAYTELLDHIAVSTADFAAGAADDDQAKSWLAGQFPASFEAVPDEDGPLALQVRDGASEPTAAQVRGVLGLPPDTAVGTDPDSLLPLARRRIGEQRQQMLATLVKMGMQRIVIDGGKINAAMRFHIDAQSAARQDAGTSFSEANRISGSGSFGYGPWSASASVENQIAYVNTEQTQTNEQLNVSADLTSSVEILFRSDYLPLNQLANADQVNRIMANSRNPDAPALVMPGPALSAPGRVTGGAPSPGLAAPTAPAQTAPPRAPAKAAPPKAPAKGAQAKSADPQR